MYHFPLAKTRKNVGGRYDGEHQCHNEINSFYFNVCGTVGWLANMKVLLTLRGLTSESFPWAVYVDFN